MRHEIKTWLVVTAMLLFAGSACHHVGEDALQWHPDGGTNADSDTDTDSDTDSDTGTAFSCEGDGVWLDEASSLCWQDPPDDTPKEWQTAFDECDGLVLAGYDDWRMPNIDDLRSLVRGCPATEPDGDCQVHDGSGDSDFDDSCAGCATSAGPGQNGCYWDPDLSGECDLRSWSTSVKADDPHRVWAIIFKYGGIFFAVWDGSNEFNVRCVRGG